MFDHRHHHYYSIELTPEVRGKLDSLSRKLDRILVNQETIMATKTEVQSDLAEIKQIVADTRGAANSAITLLKEVLERVGTAAADASDLDAFRADLALIKNETLAEQADLKAAVDRNPTPA